MPSSHLILCHPLLLLPPVPPSFRVFSNESTLHMRWPKYWSFSPHIIPSKEHPGQISFRMDWLDLLAVQETLKSLLQHHSSKASILRYSAFFTVQLSHPYMTTGKTIALTRWTFVGKVMSLLFNILSRLVITFIPRSKHVLISWLQSPSTVILELRKIKSATVSPFAMKWWYQNPWSSFSECWALSQLLHPLFSLSSSSLSSKTVHYIGTSLRWSSWTQAASASVHKMCRRPMAKNPLPTAMWLTSQNSYIVLKEAMFIIDLTQNCDLNISGMGRNGRICWGRQNDIKDSDIVC